MRVGNETVVWKPGKWTIIDDSFEHEIVNDAKGERLILIVDFRYFLLKVFLKTTLFCNAFLKLRFVVGHFFFFFTLN